MDGQIPLVALDTFIEAFRDAGYRGLPGALAELVDNSIEAEASRVDVDIHADAVNVHRVTVLDNGRGIIPRDLATALQFGGSTRFDSRLGLGRYGIGLPGSSISQARRVDVYTWTKRECPWWSYIALDEVRSGGLRAVPRPTQAAPPIQVPSWASRQGTLVVWSTCDRIAPLSRSARSSLRVSLGRTFRELIWTGREVRLDGEPVAPVDPLFLGPGLTTPSATPYGPPLAFDVDLPGRGRRRRAKVTARFSELPVELWVQLSNTEKRLRGISKGAGVSVLRANREIDSGWFFMGEKRKESYDDWWRCEVSFMPELDEFFGVTHTKQGIHPRNELNEILTPQLERVAHTLNGRVRRRFEDVRSQRASVTKATKRAERRDYLLEPPRVMAASPGGTLKIRGLRYQILHQALTTPDFFQQHQHRDILRLTLNSAHPFDAAFRRQADRPSDVDVLELLLLAAARAERRLKSAGDRAAIARHREHWSNALAAFLA